MYQPLDEMFYQDTKHQGWIKKPKVIANRLNTMKNFEISLILFLGSNG